jgi:hypothetical protein
MRISNLWIGVLILYCLNSATLLHAQQDIALHNQPDLVQTLILNPAIQKETKFSLGLFHANIGALSSGFSAFQALSRGSMLKENIDNILSNISSEDFIQLGSRNNILIAQLKINKQWQLSGGFQLTNFSNLEVPVNLIKLSGGNNREEFLNKELELGNFGLEVLQLATYHVGASYAVSDQLSLGIRLRRHRGLLHYQINRNENQLNVFLGDEQWRVDADILVRSSLAGDEIAQVFSRDINWKVNKGLSLDLGIQYQPYEKWTFLASLLQLGSIRWNGNNQFYRSRGRLQFSGIEGDITDLNSGIIAIMDSLSQLLEFSKLPGETYNSPLPTQWILGTNYVLFPNHSLDLWIYNTHWQNRWFWMISGRWQWRPRPLFNLWVNTHITQGGLPGLGMGGQLKIWVLRLFGSIDYTRPNFNLSKVRGIQANLGLNIDIYQSKRKTISSKD